LLKLEFSIQFQTVIHLLQRNFNVNFTANTEELIVQYIFI